MADLVGGIKTMNMLNSAMHQGLIGAVQGTAQPYKPAGLFAQIEPRENVVRHPSTPKDIHPGAVQAILFMVGKSWLDYDLVEPSLAYANWASKARITHQRKEEEKRVLNEIKLQRKIDEQTQKTNQPAGLERHGYNKQLGQLVYDWNNDTLDELNKEFEASLKKRQIGINQMKWQAELLRRAGMMQHDSTLKKPFDPGKSNLVYAKGRRVGRQAGFDEAVREAELEKILEKLPADVKPSTMSKLAAGLRQQLGLGETK